MKGRVTISRTQGNVHEDAPFCIRIDDDTSGCRVLEFYMSGKSLAETLTGMGKVEGDLTLYDGPFGKKKECKNEIFQLSESPRRMKEAELAKILSPYEVDGWQADTTFGTQGQIVPKDEGYAVRVPFYRYVELK